MSRPAVPPAAVSSAFMPAVMRGPSTIPARIASRSAGPRFHRQSASRKPVTPASSSFCTSNAATSAAVDRSRWKNSSSLLAGSPKVMWQWASISPGITVSPVASSCSTAGPAASASDRASSPTETIRSPSR
jgi:hypothetical protein